MAMNLQTTRQFQIMFPTIISARNSRVFTSEHATNRNSITAFILSQAMNLLTLNSDILPSLAAFLILPALKHTGVTDQRNPLRTYIQLVSCACNLPFLPPSSFTTPPFPILSEGGGGDGPESRNGNRRLRIAVGLITHSPEILVGHINGYILCRIMRLIMQNL